MTVRIEYRKLKSGIKSPRLIISDGGQRWTEKIDIKIYPRDPERKAKIQSIEAIRARREYQLFSKRHDIHFKINLRMNDFFANVIENLTLKSIRKYEATKNQCDDFFGNISIHDVNQRLCQRFIDHLYGAFASQTANSYYSTFQRLLQIAVEDRILAANPAVGVKRRPSINISHKDVLSFDEFNKMLQSPIQNDHVLKACILSFYSGIGLAEIRELQPDNIRGKILRYTRGKNGIPVMVPLKDQVYNLIKDDLPFKLPSTNGINKSILNWMKRVEIDKHITFYCFRHSFAVNLLMNGVNIKHVKELMGHTNIKTTMIYLHFVDLIKSEATINLPDLSLPDKFS